MESQALSRVSGTGITSIIDCPATGAPLSYHTPGNATATARCGAQGAPGLGWAGPA